jgi:hypothetical protein
MAPGKETAPKLNNSMIRMEYQVNDLITENSNISRVNYFLISIS